MSNRNDADQLRRDWADSPRWAGITRPVEEIQAGLKAIYCSGWQVAGDGNSAGEMYPDQSLYPVDSVPKMVERINNALLRTDQIHHMQGDARID